MDHTALSTISEALKHLAKNQKVKDYILNHPKLYKVLLHGARKLIGGETLQECVLEVIRLNHLGIHTTVDFCGENTNSEKQAHQATVEFLKLITTIAQQGLNSSISLDLSHIGLSVSDSCIENNLNQIVSHAKKNNVEVMISMEDFEKMEKVLEQYFHQAKKFENIGITVQAYLRHFDFEEIMHLPGKIRIVKGAFEEPESVAFGRGESLDNQYLRIVQMALQHGKKVSVGTHDIRLIEQMIELSDTKFHENIEFEMLHGVNEAKLIELKQRGFQVRDYLIYGKEWYLYYCHRLAENPMNFIEAFSRMAYFEG